MNHGLYNDVIKQLATGCDQRRSVLGDKAALTLTNPYCGDRVRLDPDIQNGVIRELRHEVNGCLLCKAACALMSKLFVGHRSEDVAFASEQLRQLLSGQPLSERCSPELAVFTPVAGMKSRHQCVLLPFEALQRCCQISETAD